MAKLVSEKKKRKRPVFWKVHCILKKYMHLSWVIGKKIAILSHKRWCRLNIYTNVNYFIISTCTWFKMMYLTVWRANIINQVYHWYPFHFYIWTVFISKCDSFFNIFQQTKRPWCQTVFNCTIKSIIWSNMIIKFSYHIKNL